jgi:hypothetical protein
MDFVWTIFLSKNEPFINAYTLKVKICGKIHGSITLIKYL